MRRGPIRVDADELTYTLHIQLRYELENQLLDGKLAVRNLRDAWNAGMEQRLQVKPQNDLEGLLQDVHWAVGSFGYFPSYALGAVMAAQFFEAVARAPCRTSTRRSRAVISAASWAGCARTCIRAGRPRERAGTAQDTHRQATVGRGRACAISKTNISEHESAVGSAAA